MKVYIKIALLIWLLPNCCMAADFYWVGGTGNWSDYKNHWMTTSGGSATHGRTPTITDNVIFDENSFTQDNQTVSIDQLNMLIQNLDFSKIVHPVTLRPVIGGAGKVELRGNFKGSPLLTCQLNTINFESDNDNISIETGGQHIAAEIILNISGTSILLTNNQPPSSSIHLSNGRLSLDDSLVVNQLNLYGGELLTNDKLVIAKAISISENVRVQLGKSLIKASTWNAANNNNLFALNATIDMTGNQRTVFGGGANHYGKVIFCGSPTIRGSNNFKILEFCPGSEVWLEAAQTQTISELVAPGTAAKPINISSVERDVQTYLHSAGPTITGDYLILEDVHASGAGFIGNNSVDIGNVKGWTLNYPTAKKLFWVGGGGQWADFENHWAYSTGGDDFHNGLPTILDTLIFDNNSFPATAASSEVVINQNNVYCKQMDWSKVDKPVSLIVQGGENKVNGFLHVFGSLIFNEQASSNIPYIRFKTEDNAPQILDSKGKILASTIEFYHLTSTYHIMAGGERIAATLANLRGGIIQIVDTLRVDELFINNGEFLAKGCYLNASSMYFNNQITLDIENSVVEGANWTMGTDVDFIGDSSQLYLTSENGSFQGNGQAYWDVYLCGRYTITGNNSFNQLSICAGSDIYFNSNSTQTTNTLDINSAPNLFTFLNATTEGSPGIIDAGNGNYTFSHLSLRDSKIIGAGPFIANESVDLGNNEGWIINKPEPKAFYWVGGSGNWSEVAEHWARSPGGNDFHERIPTIYDDVYFDEHSLEGTETKVMFDTYKTMTKDFDLSKVDGPLVLTNRTSNQIYTYGHLFFNENIQSGLSIIRFPVDKGNYVLNSEGAFVASTLLFEHKGSYTLTSHNQLLASDIQLVKSGSLLMNDQLHLNNDLYVSEGSFNSNDYEIDNRGIVAESGTMDIGNSIIRTGTWNVHEKVHFKSDSSTIFILGARSGRGLFKGGNNQYHDVNISCIARISDNNTYNKLFLTYGSRIEMEGTHYVKELIANGSSANYIYINGGSFKKTEGKIKISYVILNNNTAQGGAHFRAERSFDDGGNAGWEINAPITNIDDGVLNVLEGDPICGVATETTLSLPPEMLTTYQWYKDGIALDYDSSSITVSEEGDYYAELTNACGTKTYTNTVIIRKEPPPFAPKINHIGETSVCVNDEIMVELTVPVQQRSHYIWKKDGEQVGDDHNQLVVEEPGLYTITMIKGACVVEGLDSVDVVINEYPPVATTLQTNAVLYKGEHIICSNDSAKLYTEPQPGTTYIWLREESVNNTKNNASYAKNPGTYQLILQNGCGNTPALNSITLHPRSLPTNTPIHSVGSLSFCYYDSIALSVPEQDEVSYQWYVNNQPGGIVPGIYTSDSGFYHVTLTNMCGTTTIDQVYIKHIFPPLAHRIIALNDTVFCEGGSVTLAGKLSNAETINWYKNDDELGNNAPEITISESGIYTAIISNQCGRTPSENEIAISVLPIPEKPRLPWQLTRCGPGEFTINASGSKENKYVWMDETGNILGQGIDSLVYISDTEYYNIMAGISNDYCLGPLDTTLLIVLEVPEADAGEDREVLLGDKTQLGSRDFDARNTYVWSPDENMNLNTLHNPTIQPTFTTTYQLNVTAPNGCASMDEVYITVSTNIVIPNTFTPNGDGTNDSWNIRNIDQYPDCQVEIFNRRGGKLFSSKGYATPWNGEYNTQPVPIDTYYYVIDLGNDMVYKGPLTVIR